MDRLACQKIIDQWLEDGKISTDMQLHISSCAYCKETIAKLSLLQSNISPTSSLASASQFASKFATGALASGAILPFIKPLLLIAALAGASLTAYWGISSSGNSAAENRDGLRAPAVSERVDKLTIQEGAISTDAEPLPCVTTASFATDSKAVGSDISDPDRDGVASDEKTLIRQSPTSDVE